jgi:Zn-dependent protease with chaperone function/Zn-finger nucleic acid-binding protein
MKTCMDAVGARVVKPDEKQPDMRRRPLFVVERERRWRVWLLFALLIVVWLIPVVVLSLVVGLLLLAMGPAWSMFTTGLRWYHVVPTLAVAVIGATVSWYASHRDARRRLLAAMGGRPLDPHDRYHQRLANIVEELRLAGGRPEVEAVVVPSLGMNAFAFSDFRGGSVVGVSEGALSGLSRQQLQGVVAHEFAHILSGSHVTVTAACMLFGLYESIGDALGELGEGLGDADRPWADRGGAAGSLLSWFAEVAGGIVSGALSRQREYEADLAAVRYTRDPMSLALALRTIADHPVGRGYVPPGLAALCITGESGRPDGALERWLASHPPVDERIDALLRLANVSRRAFQEQAAQLEESLERREHVSPAPGLRPAEALRSAQQAASAVAATGVAGPAVAVVAGVTVAGAGSAAAGVTAAGARAGAHRCPACGGALDPADYEGVRLAVCHGCGGRFAGADAVARVIARREVGFSAEQQALADETVQGGNSLRRAAVTGRFRPRGTLRSCPGCSRSMIARHYSYDVALDVDYCGVCDAYWFDRDQLEVLQIIAERRLG